MQKSDAAALEEHHFVLTGLAPGPVQRRLASCIVVGMLVALYLITGPLSGVRLGANNAFVAVYATATFVTDAITAILLYAQFFILRSRGTLLIASGYLFTAFVAVLHFFAFPGALAPQGLIGGLQTSAWLYVSWHCGFAMFVIAYALTKDEPAHKRPWKGNARAAILWSLAGTASLVAAVGYVTVRHEPDLPHILLEPLRFSPDWTYLVGAPIVSLCVAAIVLLWIRGRSALDLWLMVVMFLYVIEQPLSRYPVAVRFSIGWYAVRVVGFLASSLVLVVLLYEITTLYSRLFGAILGQRREREARLMTGDVVAASIAHEIRQPLTAMVTAADAGLRFIERPSPNLDKAKEAFKRIAADGHRAGVLVGSIRANFKSGADDRLPIDLNDLIHEALMLGEGELRKHRVIVQAEPNGQVPAVSGNRIQLQQVLLNLILNAIDAMAAKDDPRVLTVKSAPYENDRVMVLVADTGIGVASPDADQLFNPLFTTKADGMGMGLSICRAIIEAHGGRLWFTPNTPHGAVFRFTLHASGSPSAAG
jgi:signal transduction histidine kinase